MGMVGGGPGSMIGDIHRLAAVTTGKVRLVCGAFSKSMSKSLEKGREIGLKEDRIYSSVDEMIAHELTLPQEDRMHFLAITTPNHLHVDAAKTALKSGLHVMCDKPLGINLKESLELEQEVRSSDGQFGMTYTYRGYRAIEKICEMVKEGKIGKVRKVMVDYTQGWLTDLIEKEGNKQASWRTDPKFSGAGGTIADIGTHAFNLVEAVAHRQVEALSAQVSTMVAGRQIDDDANILLQLEGDAVGIISVSQACAGEDNALQVKIYGDKGGLIWHHDEPTKIIYKTRSTSDTIVAEEEDIDLPLELPPDHPESFFKAFVHLYDQFTDGIISGNNHAIPGISDGVRGMRFIEKALESSRKKEWVQF